MGVCFSLHSFRLVSERGSVVANGVRKAPVHVIGVDGKVERYEEPIKANEVSSNNPNCFLCSSESMCVGSLVPAVPDDEHLNSDQIYFLIRTSRAHLPLTLPDLCHLAITTTAALDPYPFAWQ